MKVVHLVRRWGIVGGMEAYVWHLCHALIERSVEVTVICETNYQNSDPRIQVVVLGGSKQRRRWKALNEFRNKIVPVVCHYKADDWIIHSHERSIDHDVTTIHGPLMPIWSELEWYKKLSPRMRWWSSVERDEICASSVSVVVPVSPMMERDIKKKYYGIAAKVASGFDFLPGLEDSKSRADFDHVRDRLTCVFVGREWSRKGLERAILLVSRFGGATLDVYGVSKEEVPERYDLEFVTYHGWVNSVDYRKYHLLLHPARDEPFGMVVLEALHGGCRALVSDKVGAACIPHPGLEVVPFEAPLELWQSRMTKLLQLTPSSAFDFPSWAKLADNHIEKVYLNKKICDE